MRPSELRRAFLLDSAGYRSQTASDYPELEPGDDWRFACVGDAVRAGDEVWWRSTGAAYHAWHQIADSSIGTKILANYHPIRRKLRWECLHKFEEEYKFCPVCAALRHKHVNSLI